MAVVSIPERFKQAIICHAKQEAPRECCGIMAGSDGVIEVVYLCKNIASNPETGYLVPSHQRDMVFEDIAKRGLDLLAFYHSHTKISAGLSRMDKAHIYYPGVNIVIVSLASDPPEIAIHDLEESEC